LAIPLVDRKFVNNLPMVARLLKELGTDIEFDHATEDLPIRKLIGGLNGVFYVRDAKSECDQEGRLVIPAQSFVSEHDIKTVFGMGGSYLDGSMIAAVIFTRETIERPTAERLAGVITQLKIASEALVRQGHLY
jgi:hypothetical protein